MPKVFSEQERTSILETLIEKGKELFSLHGLRKTNVEDLTQAAGIAKGTFYAFFASKEDLCFAILEREEQFRDKLVNDILNQDKSAPEMLRDFLEGGLAFVEQNPLMIALQKRNEMTILFRKLPKDRIQAHVERDERFVRRFVSELQERGGLVETKPEIIGGLLRSFFLLTLHKDEIGESLYPDVMRLYIDVIVRGLTVES
ncbi:TetR/AcrR family transcriptional regulator [candidate division KSB1 bacterium]|nr:TetR/AcrR family transcriptional regulator [candidate division KSB1 bacterium]NIR68897.1 TetR/AcrR family transcriptional regulator [candidate division KSB1 bacterium]NIS24022.1 TetR/AcrR family transcriptional regulator [candidate division KSB1 bacterium]NIT73186.1 TetR/AcrR family transcriptional regulator [candidate division KSB1 bacterium]NIU24672.1 TetR/AcrR family transcriptional regulator [candidate division KSB1 bacterium]